jgi:hypothetical protein
MLLPEQSDEIPDDTSVVCCGEYDECYTLVPMIVMILGLGCIVVGIAVPRTYIFDSTAPARQMESTENFYIQLGYNLDICINEVNHVSILMIKETNTTVCKF